MSLSDKIRDRLGSLDPESLDIRDDSAAHAGHAGAREGGHFEVIVVAQAFVGKSLQSRHRMVYEALGPLMQSGIHALSLKAYTPDEI